VAFGAALAVGLPFLLVSALQPNYVDSQQGDQHLWMIRTIHLGSLWSFTVIDPTHYSWMLPVLAAIVLLLIAAPRHRQRVVLLAGIQLTAMVFMFTPGLVDALSRLIPYWLAWRARPVLRTRIARLGLSLAILCGALAVFRQDILEYAVDRPRHRLWLKNAHELQQLVRPIIPPHALVAADPEWSVVLPAVHLARVMAQDLHHANPADGGLMQRYAETGELLADRTSLERRQAILESNHIDFVLVRQESSAPAIRDFDRVADLVSTEYGFRLYKVKR
jgi:hypothetical protein